MMTKRREIKIHIQRVLDEYGALCTLAHEKPLCDALADVFMLERKTQKRARPRRSRELYHLAKAIGEVCLMDYEANKGRLFSEAKLLSKANPPPTPQNIRDHYGIGGMWYAEDWRGKDGKEPTPGQIRSTWAKLVGRVIPGGGHREYTV